MIVLIIDGKGVKGLSPVFAEPPGGQRRDGTRVQPAGKEGADRHVGDELSLDGIPDKPAHRAERSFKIIGVRTAFKLPVPADLDAFAVKRHAVRGLKLGHVSENTGPGSPCRTQCKDFRKPLGPHLRLYHGVCQHRL